MVRLTPLECTASFGLAPFRWMQNTVPSACTSLKMKPLWTTTTAAVLDCRFVLFLSKIINKINVRNNKKCRFNISCQGI